MHNGLDPFAMGEKKIHWNSKIADMFSKTFIKATSSGEKVKS